VKYLGIIAALVFAACAATAQTKGYVDKRTSVFGLTANMREDHRIFGYSRPDTTAQKLILFSIFTTDVKGNPYRCPLGSYYETSGLPDGDRIKAVSRKGRFVQLQYIPANAATPPTTFYVLRRYVTYQ